MARIHNKKSAVTGRFLYGILAAVILFALICFNAEGSVKGLAMVLMIGTLLAGFLGFRLLRQRMNSIVLMLILMTAMGGISTAYALSGKFALQGFLFLMSALCVSLLLMLIPDQGTPGRCLATALAGSAALISLISIDHVSTRLLSTPVLSALSTFAPVYEEVTGLEEQVRLTSIFDMPNVFAGCAGLGLLLSLGLALSAQDRKERKFHLVLLYINALAFVLAFSMGATVSIAIALIVYILMERKRDRRALLVLMGQTLLTVLLGLIPVSITALGSWEGFQPIPLLALAAGAALLCIGDHFLTEKLTAAPQISGRKGLLFGGIFAAAALAFAVTACLWTGGSTLNRGETLRRAVYPEPGNYTVASTVNAKVSVTVESQNRQEAMMHTATVLYSGDLDTAAFTVPEDALVVYFNFTADTAGRLERVVYEGEAGDGSVPLDYKLLPDFIANRLQGLFANQNAIQRLVFFEDGMKLFSQSPLVGQGLGAFESALYSIQSFHYETKYVHNHYIQTLLETGIIGLLLFLGLLVLSGFCILRARKKTTPQPFLPALGALLMFMTLHAAVEVVFSSGHYLPLAFGVFALIGVCCGEELPLPQKLRGGCVVAAGVLLITFTVLLGCNLRAAQVGHNAKTVADFQQAAQLDPFEWTDYGVSYVSNAPKQNSPQVLEQAEEYVRMLDKEQSNSIHYHLARYCFETNQMERGMKMALKQAKNTASSSQWWNNLLVMVSQYDDGSHSYQTGIQDLVAFMDQWNAENPGQIILDENVRSFVDHILSR